MGLFRKKTTMSTREQRVKESLELSQYIEESMDSIDENSLVGYVLEEISQDGKLLVKVNGLLAHSYIMEWKRIDEKTLKVRVTYPDGIYTYIDITPIQKENHTSSGISTYITEDNIKYVFRPVLKKEANSVKRECYRQNVSAFGGETWMDKIVAYVNEMNADMLHGTLYIVQNCELQLDCKEVARECIRRKHNIS